jgi:hypothetical protein
MRIAKTGKIQPHRRRNLCQRLRFLPLAGGGVPLGRDRSAVALLLIYRV